MAEEASFDTISRYYCHKCNLEITRVNQDFTCPTCNNGFIEVLENQPEASEESDSDMEVLQTFDILNDVFLGLHGGPENNRRGSRAHGRVERRRGGRGRPIPPFENLIQDFIVNLTEVGLGGLGVTPRANGPVFFLGNPGDYAWGREGLDAIVTQLLSQMDGTGPPPLAKEKIREIPVAVITQDQVDSNLQCSVCWEDFKVNEEVRKLVCEHVYHEPCIIPWLELHGTCPICRTTLSEDADNSGSMFGSQNVAPGLAALFRAASDNSTNPISSTSSSSDSSSSSSGNSSNSNTGIMDIEYD